MSVTTQQQQPRDEREVLKNQLTRMAPEFRMALPQTISPDKFGRVIMTAAQTNPDLMYADRRSLLLSCTKCAQDGLLPDGREAALVIFNTKVKAKDGKEEWHKLVQYMPMRAGIQKRAYNTGLVLSLQGHVVHEHDHFVWSQGTEEKLEHKPLFPGDRGKIIGAYAVANLKGQDRPIFRVMDRDRIERARAVSRAKDGMAWRTWWDEMAMKTVIRNLANDLPSGAEIEQLMQRDDETPDPDDSTTTIDSVLTDDQRSAPSRLELIAGSLEGEDSASE